ncbi:hypothetical protein [Helicobacter japonicus]|uniref:hypothetical protein n=1 Tax=Helicobacter japonicus TaxID=425400 RepID=UPI0026EA28BE|nr:hypothetical protein [Helicobacter japonicus]
MNILEAIKRKIKDLKEKLKTKIYNNKLRKAQLDSQIKVFLNSSYTGLESTIASKSFSGGGALLDCLPHFLSFKDSNTSLHALLTFHTRIQAR